MKKKHPKWGCFVISFQLANEEGIFMSGMSVWRILNPHYKPPKKFKFCEISKPFGMLHGDGRVEDLRDIVKFVGKT